VRKLLITLVVLAVLLVAADFGARAYAEYRAAGAVQAELGLSQAPDVSIEGFPFLWHAVQGAYPEVIITASDVDDGLLPGTRARVDLNTVTLPLGDAIAGDTSNLAARSTVLQVIIPLSSLQAALGRPDVTLSAGPNGNLQVGATVSVAGVSFPVTGSAKLSVSDDQLTLSVDGLSAAGFDLTPLARQAATALASGLTMTVPLVGLPFSVTSGDVQVSGSDVVITVNTGPVTFQELQR
jgi:LmeA-like phospholipid-binding